jgi:hypothetical protein
VAETVSAVVSEILAQGALDLSQSEALAILNRRHKTMVRRARSYRKSAVVSGGTVANQQAYTPPAGLVEALEVTVGALTYTKARRTDIAAGGQSRLVVSGDGVFMETATSAGVDQLALYPTPTSSGSVIEVYGAYVPPDLLIDNSVPFQVDDEFVEGLMAGVFASALNRPGEARSDLAVAQEQIFEAACMEAKRVEARRLRGSGPTQIRLTYPRVA